MTAPAFISALVPETVTTAPMGIPADGNIPYVSNLIPVLEF